MKKVKEQGRDLMGDDALLLEAVGGSWWRLKTVTKKYFLLLL
jgi:hypothetical protein